MIHTYTDLDVSLVVRDGGSRGLPGGQQVHVVSHFGEGLATVQGLDAGSCRADVGLELKVSENSVHSPNRELTIYTITQEQIYCYKDCSLVHNKQ